MGDIKRKRKLFIRPRKLFDRARIEEEDVLVKKYGLKNKREIWKAKTAVSKLRRRAKNLISANMTEQKTFFDRLNKMGLKVADISDVLALTESDLLERRLQTFVVKKGYAKTPREARQLIIHQKILVNGNVVNAPSYTVTLKLENEIQTKQPKIKTKKELTIEEATEAQTEETIAETKTEELAPIAGGNT